jgi:hypothetical protein
MWCGWLRRLVVGLTTVEEFVIDPKTSQINVDLIPF